MDNQNPADTPKVRSHYLYHNRFSAGPDYHIIPHSHPFWHVEWIRNGELETRIGESLLINRTGDAVLLPPCSTHSFVYRAENTTIFSVKFETTGVENATYRCSLPGREEVHHLGALLDVLLSQQGRPSRSRLLVIDHLLCALMYLFINPALEPDTPPQPSLADMVRAEVEHRAGRPLTVADLSRKLGFSESHIRTEFRRQEHTPLKEYIDRQRALAAAHYLAYSDMPIKEIVSIMEFPDPQCFSRFCRRILGLSPRQVRAWITGGSNTDFADERYLASSAALKNIFSVGNDV